MASNLQDFTASLGQIRQAAREIVYADFGRSSARGCLQLMDQASRYAATAFPSREISRRLGWDYPDATAATELNGARVRINAAVDDIASIPDGDFFVPTDLQIHLTDAIVAACDLMQKIWDKGAAAPSATERVTAGAGEVGSAAGDLLSGPIADALAAIAGNLWVWLAVAGVVVFFVYVRPALGGLGGA